MKKFIELSDQARDQEFFKAGEFCWNKGTLIIISCTTHEQEVPQGKFSEFLLLDILKIAF